MAHTPSVQEKKGSADFKPYVSPDQDMPEFTLRAIVLGSMFGIVFGAVSVYLALRAGLTVSASIPIAVLAIAVLKRIGKSTILENNMVQTIGSAGESIAAGAVFTTPAFLFVALGAGYFSYIQITTLTAVGGVLGVLLMVPMRRALIVKEHGELPYPEGTACAEVLIAGERGGQMAGTVFAGFWIALSYTLLQKVGHFWRETFQFASGPRSSFPNATLTSEVTPEYLGVGYIIGPKIAGVMVSGSVLSWLGLIPLLSMFVPDSTVQADLLKLGFTQGWIDGHSHAEWFYRAYIRYIGAGAVAMAGILTLVRTIPTIYTSVRDSVRDLRTARLEGSAGKMARTDRDIPITWVLGGSVVLALIIAILPNVPHGSFPGNIVTGLLILIFGFFFVAVSSRIVGLIGSSSNPISGMTIATLLGTTLIFLSMGMGGDAYQAAALSVGAIVCIAAANAGATSQDLKTGFIVGATPIRQQIGLLIGVVVSVTVVGLTLIGLHESQYGPIGGERLPAPQGTLMAVIIKGVLSRDLPWAFIFVGAALAVVIQLCGVSGLAWAVGAYLPISTTFPIFLGGTMRWLSDRIRKEKEESEISSGMLYSTGLVAGGSISGLLVAVLISVDWGWVKAFMAWAGSLGTKLNILQIFGEHGVWSALFMFAVLCFFLLKRSLRKLEL